MPDRSYKSACLQKSEEKFLIKAVKLYGSSMLPFYRSGEIILCNTYFDKKKLKVGDCAIYDIDGCLYLHRIEKIKEDGIVFSNDDDLPSHFVKWERIKAVPIKKNSLLCPFEKFSSILLKQIRKIKASIQI